MQKHPEEQNRVIPVHDEPRHVRCYEDDSVSIYRVTIEPGDKSLYHSHNKDTVYISLCETTVSELKIGETEESISKLVPGICVCRHHSVTPLVHQVGNDGRSTMRMIGIELKNPNNNTRCEDSRDPCVTLLWATDGLAAYKLKIPARDSTLEYRYGLHTTFIPLNHTNCIAHHVGDAPLSLAVGSVISSYASPQKITNLGNEALEAIFVALN